MMNSLPSGHIALWALCLTLAACGGGGGGDSSTSPTSTPAINQAPVAHAGPTLNVSSGSTVTLNASGSTDINGDALRYEWSMLTKPAGSAAALSSSTAVQPTFVADQPGSYVCRVTVSDGSLSSSATVTITVSGAQTNTAPVAQAGPAQNVLTGATVLLDGSASSDANGDALSFSWSLSSLPTGSTAALSAQNVVSPSFVADKAGTYVASLNVSDGQATSTSSTVTITVSTANVAPVANAGSATNVSAGTVVSLDGSASSDANGDTLSYTWSLLAKPVGSSAALSDTHAAKPSFTADQAGTYVAQLIVNDGVLNSTAATVTITATALPDQTAPVANPDTVTTDYQTALTGIDVLANDSDNSGIAPTLLSLSNAANGSFSINTGKIDFTPNAGFYGTATVNYLIQDANANQATGLLSVTVYRQPVISVANATPGKTNVSITLSFDQPNEFRYMLRLASAAQPTLPELITQGAVIFPPAGFSILSLGQSTPLTPSTPYALYFIARGSGGNWQAQGTVLNFTTLAP